ncbi:PH-interacting protein [Echinococcus granulosus]|uniref:PH-interacting protein n=1 Tax=Echinococcus granulosus TaxID=6210 RepID=W6UXM7_ECHGR|nr:PH-interacting protein [Echinococcus granulosus]EUB58319.1 PH-interacting protein [Echinococcus granulosus]
MTGHSCGIWNYRSVPKPTDFLSLIIQDIHRKIVLQQHVLAHRSAIYCLKYDCRSDYLISASDDYTIKIWSLRSSQPSLSVPLLRHTLRGHLAEIIEVDVSIDNHLMVSVDADCTLVIWCLRTGQPLVSFRGSRRNRVISGLSFIPIPQPSEFPNEKDGWLLVSSYGCGLHFIRYTHTLVVSENEIGLGVDGFVECCCSIRLHPTTTFNTRESDTGFSNNTSAVVLDVSPGGHHVAVGCTDHSVRMFTFSEGGCPISAGRLSAHEDDVNSVAFSNSGVQLATGSADGGSCWLWNLRAGLWTGLELKLRKRPKSRPCVLRWSCKDTYLAVCLKSGAVNVFSGRNGERVAILTGHEGAVYAVATSPLCEEILATGGADGRFYIWRFGTSAAVIPSILFFYRFPAPQPTTDLGITWLQSTELEVPLAGATGTATSDSLQGSATVAVEDDEERRRIRGEGGLQSQRITCCVAMPTANGPGFLVATKAGVISLFAPSQEIESVKRLSGAEPPPYEEQFLHWEMDNAALREVSQPSNTVALALGSPASSQSFNAGSTSQVQQPQQHQQPQQQDAYSSYSNSNDYSITGIFQPPPCVLFQLVHEPSGVPFSRLPPAYLTTLRGYPYSPDRQIAQVPGRYAFRPIDARPTTMVDDDGEEVVVDDIQFANNVPSTYCCPAPLPSSTPRDYTKTYLWCCHWLSGKDDLICPLSKNDVKLELDKFLIRQESEKKASREGLQTLTHSIPSLTNKDVDGATTAPVENAIRSAAALDETQSSSLVVLVGEVGGGDGDEGGVFRLPGDSLLDMDGGEVADDSENDSDWSAHRDAEAGWGSSRTRRNRPPTTRSRTRRWHLEAAEQPPSTSRHRSDVELASPLLNGSLDDSVIRRSARQRQRLRRERQNQLSLATQLEAVRTLRRARRSERLRRFRRQRGLPETVTMLRRSATMPRDVTEPVALNSLEDLEMNDEVVEVADAIPANPKERTKQQIIRSIDFINSHHVDLPLLEPPPNGFPGVSNPTGGVTPGPLDSEPVSWLGPHLDWLSATKPSASPYVPQLGDRLVYVMRGHKEYLSRAWHEGSVPAIDVINSDGGCLEAERLPLPWEQNSTLPGYLCCHVSEMAVHFMRTTNALSNRRPHSTAFTSSSLRHRNATSANTTSTGRFTQSLVRASPAPIDPVTDTTDAVDSFVRLVSLRLVVERQQPYSSLTDSEVRSLSPLPKEIFIRYHDVDGVLDFLVLRSVFDEAINRSWNAGDVFICPVENVWWRGRVLRDFSVFNPSTSSSTLSLSPSDPWLGVRVRWLENHETGAAHEPLLPPSLSDCPGVESLEGGFDGDVVITFSDCLSPWDMHPWVSRLPISDDPTTTFSSVFMHSGEIRIPVDRLTRLFGSRGSQPMSVSSLEPSTSFNHTNTTFGEVIERIKAVLDKLMTLNAAVAFNSPVDLAAFPNYIVVNPNLVDLLFIRNRLENLFYRQSEAIRFDLEQIFKNALRYNEPTSLIVRQAQLVTSLALKAISDASFNLDKLMDNYISAVAVDPQLDPAFEVPQNSSSSTLPAVHEAEDDEEGEGEEEGVEEEQEASIEDAPVVLPSTSSPDSPPAVTTKRSRSSENSTHLAPASKRTALNGTGGSRYPLRTLTAHPPPPPPLPLHSTETEAGDALDWRKVCRQLLREVKRDRRSFFFREPVNINQYATYRQIIQNPMDLGSVQTRLLQHAPQGDIDTYSGPRQFLEDLELIVNNSRLFNRDSDTQVYSDTRWLSRWIKKVARKRLSLYLGDDSLPAFGESAQYDSNNDNEVHQRLRSLRPSTRASLPVATVPEPVNISNGVGQMPERNREAATVDVYSGGVGRIRASRGRKSRRSLRTHGTPHSTTSSSSSTSASTSVGRSTHRRSLRTCYTLEAPRRSSRRRLCRAQVEEGEQLTRLRPRRSAALRHYYEVDEEDGEEERSSQDGEGICPCGGSCLHLDDGYNCIPIWGKGLGRIRGLKRSVGVIVTSGSGRLRESPGLFLVGDGALVVGRGLRVVDALSISLWVL